MHERDPKKFDPSRASALDAPERERYLPGARLVQLLELSGDELVVDYGAGSGRLTIAVADELPGGRVLAVDESDEMFAILSERLAAIERAEAVLISGNRVPLDDASADRVLAVNLLHEVRGESALAEMRRLVAPGGFVLVVDWERGRERESGPPDELLYSADEAAAELESAGFAVESAEAGLPYHYALIARPR
jgi:ubiquinone/menaquinone biosynthesis C-methylase UbiE